MRYQGKITTWKDDQGFGFITPRGGGPQVFVHIKSFSRQARRPECGEIVTYELATNDKGQARAENTAIVGDLAPIRKSSKSGIVPLTLAFLFLAFIASAVFFHKLPLLILGIYLGASCLAFLAYWIDKSAARNDRWRTQESTLLIFGLIGGWPGLCSLSACFATKPISSLSRQPFGLRLLSTVAHSPGCFRTQVPFYFEQFWDLSE
jgi:uncharacterized membrane protein YsdA (DUF1294 family)/cold shock CspA family protein